MVILLMPPEVTAIVTLFVSFLPKWATPLVVKCTIGLVFSCPGHIWVFLPNNVFYRLMT